MKLLLSLCCAVPCCLLGIVGGENAGTCHTECAPGSCSISATATTPENCHPGCAPGSCALLTKASAKSPSCTTQSACTTETKTAAIEYTEDELKAIAFMCDVITQEKRASFSQEEIEAGAKVSLEGVPITKLRAGILAELGNRNFDMSSLPAGRCTKYSACSVNMDLSYAQGEELKRYETEKEMDGRPVQAFVAPDFSLPTTKGTNIRLADYKGKPVALVFLAVHCSHSWDTLPLLEELKDQYGEDELVILPVYTNSGSVADVKESTAHKNLNLALAVAEGKALSQKYDSLIVPSVFLINEKGEVTKRLVGYKNKAFLQTELAQLVASKGTPTTATQNP